MSDKYLVVNEPESMFLIPEDMQYDRLHNYEVAFRLLERIEGLSEIIYSAYASDAYEPQRSSIQNSAEVIRVRAKQASQVVEHIRTKGDKS